MNTRSINLHTRPACVTVIKLALFNNFYILFSTSLSPTLINYSAAKTSFIYCKTNY